METTNTNNSFELIIESLMTRQEADHFLDLINILSENLFTKKVNLSEKITEIFPVHLKILLVKSLQNNQIDLTNNILMQSFIESLKKYLESIPVIGLTLAFSPKQQTIKRIYSWLAFQIKKPVLLDITVNKNIIGGAVIDVAGIHFEYTIHKILKDQLTQNTVWKTIPST